MPHRLLSRTLAVCILPVLAFLLVQTALAQTDNGKEITKRAFVADTSAVEPGKAFHVGFHFQIVEGWHMYWRFAGGLGEPLTVVEWNLPPGWEAGPIEFPLPHAEKDKTGWTLYAYGHEVMFPVKITPPKKFTGEVTLRAKIKWQVCADVCLMPPGPEEVQIKLTAGAAKPANEALFSKWLGELPRTDEPPTKDVKFDLSGKKLSVRVGGLPADAKAEFFVIPPSRIKTSFEMDKHPGAETAPDGVRVFTFPFDNELPWSGLLVTTGADGTRKGWYIGDPPPVEVETPSAKSGTAEDDGDTWDPFDDIAKGEKGRSESTSLLSWLIKGFLGGLLLNLMPCVLPVISLKIFGFVRQAGESRDRVFKLGLAFCAGVFGFFLVLALLVLALASANKSLGWGAQFSNPVALTIMVAVMFLFGLSLLGVFEITLGGAESKLSEASSKEGAGGAFVHGFFTTLLGTSCTAPLVGPVIGAAVNEPGSRIFALFAAVATGLSLPYFLLTWQPAWMKFLPKPGMWMVRFKQILGFVMVGFAVWLLNSLPSAAMVVTVAGFLLTLGFAAWLLGTFHEAKWALPSVLALAVGGWFVFVHGKVERPPGASSGLLTAVRRGLNDNRPVFVDFTADWCLNCKFFENTVLHTQPVQDAFKAKNVLFVKADYTAAPPDISAALKKMGRAGVPLYVLFRKRGDYWISESLSQSGLLEQINKL
jgi:thiol:disulfide interchange protein DsbD